MIQVAALTSGRFVPSARFRIRQYLGPLSQLGIQVTEYMPFISKYGPIPGWPRDWNPIYGLPLQVLWQTAKLASQIPGILGSRKNQITWLERQLLDGCLTLEGLLKNPLVLDVDDAVWLRPPFGRSAMKYLAKQADVVIAGNRYLADWFSQYTEQIRIIPTAVDTDRFRPIGERAKPARDRFGVGWTGISWNLPYFQALEAPLKQFMDRFRDSELVVIADRPPRFSKIPSERVRYLPWSVETEIEGLHLMDVGLMPLPDNEWTRGKCSFKMLQYMASGIPVVVSPVGMNADVLAMAEVGLPATSESEWYDSLRYFYENREQRLKFGEKGRIVIENKFARKVVAEDLAATFAELS